MKLLRYPLLMAVSLTMLSAVAAPEGDSTTSLDTEALRQQVISPADSVMSDVWTFDDCLNWAKSHNIDLRKSWLSLLLADEDVKSAKDAWLPTVDFSTSHSFTNYPAPGDGQKNNLYSSSYGIGASWTVWEGNTRKYKLESSKLMRRQQEYAGESIIVNLELGILQAYMNIMYNKEAIDIARQTLEVTNTQLARAKRLMDTGRISKVEYAQFESQQAQDSYSVVQAENAYASAKMTLKKLLELGISYDINVADVSFPNDEALAPLPAAQDVYEYASTWLPDIKSNEINKDIYEYDIKTAKAGYMPRISLSGSIGSGYTTAGNNGWGTQMKNGLNEMVGLSLSVPIFDGNATKRAVAKAKLNALEYELQQESLLNTLSQTIESLYIDARGAQAKYRSGLTQLDATQLTSDLVNRQFELGSVNTLEWLTAHNNLLNARLELLQSKYMSILSAKTIEYYASQKITLP